MKQKTRLVSRTCGIPKCYNTPAYKRAGENCYKHRDENGDMSFDKVLAKRKIAKDLKDMERNPYKYMESGYNTVLNSLKGK